MDIYTKVAGITQESVKDYKHHTLPNHVLSRQEMKTKQIENALRGFAAGCAEEDIEAYCAMYLLQGIRQIICAYVIKMDAERACVGLFIQDFW